MITRTTSAPIETSNIKPRSFTIMGCGRAFDILTSKLYTNKPAAILRELGANMLDEHIASGIADVPFVLHLPNILEPYISFRDFGRSMNHEFMLNNYAAAFYSSKSETNEANGAFGVGRLSLLSLVDSFVVRCFQNGYEKTYSVFKQNGVPEVAFMGKIQTTEADGTEVQAAVSSEYFNDFQNEARSVYRFFNIKPIIKGANITFDKEKTPIFEGKNWKMYSTSGKCLARMGCYSYPVDAYALGEYPDGLYNIFNSEIVVDFEIGDIDAGAGREALSYDKVTIQNIISKFTPIKDELAALCSQKFNSAQNRWQAMIILRDLKRQNLSKFISPIFKGVEISDYLSLGSGLSGESYRLDHNGKIKKSTESCLDAGQENVYFVPSGLDKIKARIRNFVEQNHKQITVIYGIESVYKDWIVKSDIPEFPSLATIEPKPREKSIGGPSSKSKVYSFENIRYSYRASGYWNEETVDLVNGEGVYVVINNYRVGDKRPSCFGNNLSNIANVTIPKIYGVKTAYVSKLGAGWITLDAYLKAEILKQLKTKGLPEIVANYNKNSELPELPAITDKTHEISKYNAARAKITEDYKKSGYGYGQFSWAHDMGISVSDLVKEVEPTVVLTDTVAGLNKKYELLEFLSGADAKKVQKYIDLVDTAA